MTDGNGLPIKIAITPGNAHDLTAADELFDRLPVGAMLLADKPYDADWLRAKVKTKRSWANIPPKSNRKISLVFSPWLYKKRNLIESFFSKLKCYRRCGFYFPISTAAISGDSALGFRACGFNREQGRGVCPGDTTIDEPVIYHRGFGHSAFSQPANSVGEIRFFSPFFNRIA